MKHLLLLVIMLFVALLPKASQGEEVCTITTVAGTGEAGFSGDGGAATAAQLNEPRGIAIDLNGDLLVADTRNNRIRRISSRGIITTVAGTRPGFSGDGDQAIGARLNFPTGLAVDHLGSLFIADTNNNRIRKVAPNGIITTYAGTGQGGYSGDNVRATAATLSRPTDVTVLINFANRQHLYIADAGNHRIRWVSPDGMIRTFAGTGVQGRSGDGPMRASLVQLSYPSAVAASGIRGLVISDSSNSLIRIGNTDDGIVNTLAAVPAAGEPPINLPMGAALDGQSGLFFAELYGHRIRKVTDGVLTTVAGTGEPGFSGDGEDPISAELNLPYDVATTGFDKNIAAGETGYLFIADSGNHRIREVTCLIPPEEEANPGGSQASSQQANAGSEEEAAEAAGSEPGGGGGTAKSDVNPEDKTGSAAQEDGQTGGCSLVARTRLY